MARTETFREACFSAMIGLICTSVNGRSLQVGFADMSELPPVFRNETLPEIVYHYTSIEAMMNIVASRTVWCTSIAYLNDASEREYLLGAVTDRLTELHERGQIDDWVKMTINTGSYHYDITSFANEPFVASFAAQADSLMHWRSYCPQQSGVALGFRSSYLRNACLDESLRLVWWCLHPALER